MLRRLSLIVATAAAMVALGEALFRVLPVSTSTATGYHVHSDVLGNPPHHEWRVSTGWDLRNAQTLRSNNKGFAATRDLLTRMPLLWLGTAMSKHRFCLPQSGQLRSLRPG